jgi:metal-dependent HD superfamily phosphatase/phosphodiesterase
MSEQSIVVQVSRRFEAAPERVFEALLDEMALDPVEAVHEERQERFAVRLLVEGRPAVGALHPEAVHLEAGDEKPVRLRIEMCNSAGVFQLDQLFREKLGGSGLESYMELEARIEGEEGEKRLFKEFRL